MSTTLMILFLILSLAYGVLAGGCAGFLLGARRRPSAEPAHQRGEESPPSEAELARRELERQQLIDDNRAFRAMLDYNTSMAYGMVEDRKDG